MTGVQTCALPIFMILNHDVHIGVAMSDQKKLHVVIQDHDHNTWKKHLDNVKNIDSDVRTKVYGTLVNLEEKHVKARK